MQVAKVIGWEKDETPTVPQGLQVQALATGLAHPRSLYVLPDEDVLVVESNGLRRRQSTGPRDIITGWVQWFAGARATDANRIKLVREPKDGALRTAFLDHLHSAFGAALIGHDLCVANTDAIIRYPYQDGERGIAAPGTKVTDLPGGPIDHHWTKALLASPDGSKVMSGSDVGCPRTAELASARQGCAPENPEQRGSFSTLQSCGTIGNMNRSGPSGRWPAGGISIFISMTSSNEITGSSLDAMSARRDLKGVSGCPMDLKNLRWRR